MIIYNVTTHVANAVNNDWIAWMKVIHIPEVMHTGCFSKFQMIRMMETDETEGITYAVQYYAESKADYNRYIEVNAPVLRKNTIDKWGDKTISFSTLMEIVH
ncbi:DUF4286 family protein [soil metagenome]